MSADQMGNTDADIRSQQLAQRWTKRCASDCVDSRSVRIGERSVTVRHFRSVRQGDWRSV